MHDEGGTPNADDYLIVANWDRFQHYKTGRRPIWIKNYIQLLQDPDYLGLSFAGRGLLHGLWLAYASAQQRLTVGQAKSYVRGRFGDQALISLNEAGFVHWSASKVLALEVEVDKEPLTPTGKTPDQELLNRALNIAADWQGGSGHDFDEALDNLERQYHRQIPLTQRMALWDEVVRRDRNHP